MAINPLSILKLSVFQTILGQQALNVQYYQVLIENNVENQLDGFAQAFGQSWYGAIRTFQSSAVLYSRAVLEEVNGVVFDQYAFDPGDAGAVTTGNSMPPYVCYAVRQNRTSKLTRNGQKRFAGVTEEAVTNGAISTLQQAAILAACAPIMLGALQFEDPNDGNRNMTVRPIIWGGNDPAYPEGRLSSIGNLSVSQWVTTQNSRKVRTRDGL